MSNYCYSANGDDYNYSELSEAVERAWDDKHPDGQVGDVLTIWRGDASEYDPIEFVPDICEYMGEQAYDEAGDYAADWPGASKEQERELQKAVEQVVAEWIARHSLKPPFMNVSNTKAIKVRILSMTGDYEELERTA
jgi:hypothetical protein